MRVLLVLWTAFVIACSGPSAVTMAGAGGGVGADSGSVATSVASTGSVVVSATSTGTGGNSPATSITIRPPSDCVGAHHIAPIDGEEAVDGIPLHEGGAISLRRMVPPSYPFHVASWTYEAWAKAGTPCGRLDHEAVAFVAPANQPPPVAPVGWSETAVVGTGLIWQATGTAIVELALDVALQEGEALWVGVRQHVSATGRTCVNACQGSVGSTHPDAWHSDTNAAGTVESCPGGACAWEPLSVSPTAAAGLPRLDWNFTATGM